MLEKINYSLFYTLHKICNLPLCTIDLIKFIAKDLINIVPLLMIVLWLWGPRKQIVARRHLLVKVALSIFVSMIISCILRCLFPHDRPFVHYPNYNFLHHAADCSFPSNHGTIIFSFALSFLFWHRIWSGMLLMVVALFISWSRVYLNAHWPLDMFGGLLAGLIGCISTQALWKILRLTFYYKLRHIRRARSFYS